VLIVGDYTARIGDPSGRSDERPGAARRSPGCKRERVSQSKRFECWTRETDGKSASNGEWLGQSFSYAEGPSGLARATITVARNPGARRLRAAIRRARADLDLRAALSASWQAYDSVAIEADIENRRHRPAVQTCSPGRERDAGLRARPTARHGRIRCSSALDGERQDVEVARQLHRDHDPADEMFGKTMSIPDKALPQWWELVVGGGPHPDDPMEWKLELGAAGSSPRWHGDEEAPSRRGALHPGRAAEHQAPDEVPEVSLPKSDPVPPPGPPRRILRLAFDQPLRDPLISQGAVKIDGEPVFDLDVPRARLEGGPRPGRETAIHAVFPPLELGP